ncbi:DNA polymerase III subunit alpha, partial [Megamonas funiformis]
LTLYQENLEVRKLIDFAKDVEGMPRHSSTHAAGVVISKDPVTDYVPIQISEGTFVTQYDKDCVEELGLLKMDFLGLRTLTVIADALTNIKNNRGIEINLDEILLEDEKTSQMLCRGETGAVFQLESAGMTTLVKDLQPTGFADLIPVMALYRPGPLGSGMVTDFINGRHGRKKVTYIHPDLEPILKETFGVILYQEQVMQIVQVLAGFTLGQADILRRAMGKKKHDVLMSQKENFLKGAKDNGVDDKLAETIFDLLLHFADYGFNKSHSAAYALVSWRTAYLKAHYPQEFMAAILTSLMTSNKIGEYIEQCKHMGIDILPPDINASRDTFTVDKNSIRFGLAAVKNVGENALKTIVDIREKDGLFKSLEDFCSRVSSRCINKRALENLIKCGAFDSLGYNRAQYMAVLDQAMDLGSRRQKDLASGQMDLFGDFMEEEESIDKLEMPKMQEFPKIELLNMEKEITGFYITGHPLEEYREKIQYLTTIESLEKQKDGKYISVAGIIRKAKRVTTKKGDMMCFLEIEDFLGVVEVIVFPKAFYDNINYLVPDIPVVVRGKLDKSDDNNKIIADKVIGLEDYTPEFCIIVKSEQEDNAFFSKITETLQENAGPCPVYMYFMSSKKMIKGNREFWIDGSETVVNNLKNLLGKNSIKQR